MPILMSPNEETFLCVLPTFVQLDYSVGKFFEDARQATRDVLDRGRVPIVAGGTGLYLRWYVSIFFQI